MSDIRAGDGMSADVIQTLENAGITDGRFVVRLRFPFQTERP